MQQLKILFFLCLIHTVSFAQKDTSGKQTVEIISSFKPALLKSAKIYFSGIQLSSDTEKITRPYSIPSQNLFYTYRSISIKPLALQIDPSPSLGVLNYIKAGYGNYATPYFNGSVGWGDGKTSLVNIYADYISSKGKIANQDYDNLSIKGEGSYFLPKQELYAAAGLRKRNYFLYGYNHDSLQFDKSAVKQSFQLIDFNLGMRNIVDIQQGFSYNPSLKVDLFTSKNQLSENSFLLSLPLQKKWREAFFLTFAATLDFTQYATKQLLPENLNLTNRVVQLSPAVKFQSNQISIKAGVSPAWDNMDFVLLPDISAEVVLQKKAIVLQGGWVGSIKKNTYRLLSDYNPFLSTLKSQTNTRAFEIYGGIKSSLGKHLNLSARASWITYENYQFFINDTSNANDGKSFLLSNERSLNNLKIQGDISYILQDKFSFTGTIVFNGYSGMQDNQKAWNTIPMEMSASMKWWATKKLLLKSDFYLFAGSYYLEKGGISKRMQSGADLNVGAEYKFNKQFSTFINLNNIFGGTYERWHNYPVYGFNFIGGIVFHF